MSGACAVPTPTGTRMTTRPSRKSVRRRTVVSTITRVRTVPCAPSADRGTQPCVPFGSAGSRTRTHSAPPARRRVSGRTMFVVSSGVRASRTPTRRAERAGVARATTSRRTAAQVVSSSWRASLTGAPISNAAFGAAGTSPTVIGATAGRAAGSGTRASSPTASRIAAVAARPAAISGRRRLTP